MGLLLFCLATVTGAQERPGSEPLGRSGLPSLPTLEEQTPTPPGTPVLPPLPPLSPEERQQLPQQVRLWVRQIIIVGNTVLPAEKLDEVTHKYVNQRLVTEDLEALRLELTRLYVEAAYINSGVIIPDQTVDNGVVTFQVIEGQLTDIEVSGTRWFRDHYIRQRLALGAGPPLHIGALQERLLFLQQDERIARLDAELKPGVERGEGVLQIKVEEVNPFKFEFTFNNYQSPTVGAERELFTLTHLNLTGHGDPLSVTYGRSEGIDLQLDTNYTIPLTARDTTLSIRYRRNTFNVIQEQFQQLDIKSRSEAYGFTLRQPIIRTLSQELAVAFSMERQENKTTLLGDPFSFSLGANRGHTAITAARLSLEWTDRTPRQVLAARSRLSLGVDAFKATIRSAARADGCPEGRADDCPDGRFVAWLGQFQWARLLTDWGLQVLTRVDTQLTTQPLLSLEQIAVGGRFTVRGYRENQLVRDNAILASAEARIPVVRQTAWADVVQLVPFVDYGYAWNMKLPTPRPRYLASVGLGLRWALTLTSPVPLRPELEIYWGIPLKHVKTEGGNLQDAGVHLQFSIAAF